MLFGRNIMDQEYFEKISDFAKKTQAPFQALAELNIKTFQEFASKKPIDFTNTKQPEDLLEKQIELAIANGRCALEYMQQSFNIMEQALLSVLKETKECKK
jgi:hypothetical protein